MRLSRIATHARLDALLAARDPSTLIGLIAMPLLLIAFLWRGYTPLLPHVPAGVDASGADVATPGFAVMFVFFIPAFLALSVMREHTWHTWSRLLVSEVRPVEVVLGKSVPYFMLGLVQTAVLFGFGLVVLHVNLTGSVLALAAVAAATALVATLFGWMIVAVCKTSQQAMTLGNLGGIALAGLGGALQPVHVLPGWVQAVAPATPHYWAVKGSRLVILEHGSLADVAGPVGVLLLFGLGAAAVFVACYRPADLKKSFV